MFRISLISVMQLSIDLANNKFGGSNCGENKTRILSALFMSKDPTRADYLTSGAKKTFQLLWHAFT